MEIVLKSDHSGMRLDALTGLDDALESDHSHLYEAHIGYFAKPHLVAAVEAVHPRHGYAAGLHSCLPRRTWVASEEAYLCLAFRQEYCRPDAAWEGAAAAQGCRLLLVAAGVPLAAAIVAVEPCSQVEAPS